MGKYKNYEENLLYKISMRILEYVVISFYVVVVSVCSFGVLFIPVISSSYYYYYQQLNHKNILQFKDLYKGFLLNIKQTIVLNILVIAVGYVGYLNYVNFGVFDTSTYLYYPIMISTIYSLIVLFMVIQLVTYFNVKIHKAIAFGNFFVITYFITTVTIIILLIALFFTISLQPAMIIIVLGLYIHLSSLVYKTIFIKHSPEEVTNNEQ